MKTMLTKKFREKESPIVFRKEYWSKIKGAILGMKPDYFRKHNTKLVNIKQQAGK